MCDTVCSLSSTGTLFAKNSDRPVDEIQLIEAIGRRDEGTKLRTQYLTIADHPAVSLLGSRPDWLWGLEHGVNEHRVAIGNERVFTVDDASSAPPALIGMDLVRLGLERGTTADAALTVMTDLLDEHGQGGIADAANQDAYFSSFLVADPTSAWILETSGRTWAAKPVTGGGAISNRISLGDDWVRASPDVRAGQSFQAWHDPRSWAAMADVRLACTLPAVSGPQPIRDARDLAALMRHHGERPWGRPGDDASDVGELPPAKLEADGRGFSVCMHLRDYQATAASMICELPNDPDRPMRAWVASGSPCVSVFVPVFPPSTVPDALGEPATWQRFRSLRGDVEEGKRTLREVRTALAPVEAQLWAEADRIAPDPAQHAPFVASAWDRVDQALRDLGV